MNPTLTIRQRQRIFVRLVFLRTQLLNKLSYEALIAQILKFCKFAPKSEQSGHSSLIHLEVVCIWIQLLQSYCYQSARESVWEVWSKQGPAGQWCVLGHIKNIQHIKPWWFNDKILNYWHKKKKTGYTGTIRPTDRPTDTPSYRDARTHLKNNQRIKGLFPPSAYARKHARSHAHTLARTHACMHACTHACQNPSTIDWLIDWFSEYS